MFLPGVPDLTVHVSQFSGPDEMSNEPRSSKYNAKDRCGDISPSEERLLAPDP